MHKIFEYIIEGIGWVKIVAGSLFLSLILGAVIYYFFSHILTLIFGIVVVIFGIIIGIKVANKAWKGKGTVYFLSRTMATPELDDKEELSKF